MTTSQRTYGCMCAWGDEPSVDYVPPPHECDYHAKIREQSEQRLLALRNVMRLANQMRFRASRGKSVPDAAEHLLRFCKAAGVEPSILRSAS